MVKYNHFDDVLFRGGLKTFLGYAYEPSKAELAKFQADNPTADYVPFEIFLDDLTYDSPTPALSLDELASAQYSNGTDLNGQQQFTSSDSSSRTTTMTTGWTFNDSVSDMNGLTRSISRTASQTATSASTINVGFSFVVTGGASATNTDANGLSTTVGSGISSSNTVTRAVSLSDTTAQSSTETQTWTWNATVPVPAHSLVVEKVIVRKADVSCDFTAPLRFRGALWFVAADGCHIGVDTVNWFDLWFYSQEFLNIADRQSQLPRDRDHRLSRQWRHAGARAGDGGA
jgi:hypothetical protein